MAGIRNSSQLVSKVTPVIKQVIDEILDKLEEINKDLIQQIVYMAYNPVYYERTMQFKDAWVAKKQKIVKNVAKGSFLYSPELMTYVQENAQHGSFYAPPGDARDYLAAIIYQGLAGPAYGNGPINGPWAEARDAWSALIGVVEDNLDDWIKQGFQKRGFVVR